MTNLENSTDKQFEKKAQKAFDQQVSTLDSQTLQHLREARENALAQHNKRSCAIAKWLTGAAAGLAFASVLTFMIAPSLMQSKQLSPLDDLEILTAEAELDLVTQLDFYEWLEESLDES